LRDLTRGVVQALLPSLTSPYLPRQTYLPTHLPYPPHLPYQPSPGRRAVLRIAAARRTRPVVTAH